MSTVEQKFPMVHLVTYMIGLFDPYGVNHSERVADLCVRMGRHIQMMEQELEDLEISGLLHDIGKVGIPEWIRTKPGQLTEAELFMMQQHSLMGYNIIQKMNGSISKKVHQAILHHHENWNGTGYPDKLKGNAIPWEARFIRIADTFDAMTHSRGIRMPLTDEQAITVMQLDQETKELFDPNLFRVFLEVMRKG
jgi:HD-GYP domain-containing protein (c-di-GMP phosphodiesterase class II)